MKLAGEEGLSATEKTVTELGALLHDIADWKVCSGMR